MTIYAPALPSLAVSPRNWRQAAETAWHTTQTNLQATIRHEKALNRALSPDVITAFAAVHMRTENARPIAPAAHHLLWLHLMCDPAIKRLLIVGTPESAKTTWALAYAACHVGFYPESPVIIAAVSGSVAEKRSLALRNIIESPEFAATFPTVKQAAGMAWTGSTWSVAENGRPHAGRLHPTVSAYGTGGSITGSRAQLIIADDILDYDNTQTQHQRDGVDAWFHTSLLSRLMARTGRIILIGNAYHHDDTIARLRRSEGWVTCHIPLLSDGKEVRATITYPDDYTGRPMGEAAGVEVTV